jgi:hypothetical protein
MPRGRTAGTSKSEAIRNALGQLGWHASGKDVVAFLANYGIDVKEGLVHRVKLESLKDPTRVKRQKGGVQGPKVPVVRRVPAQRTYRR